MLFSLHFLNNAFNAFNSVPFRSPQPPLFSRSRPRTWSSQADITEEFERLRGEGVSAANAIWKASQKARKKRVESRSESPFAASAAAMFKESEGAEDGVGLVRQLLTRSRTLVLIKHIIILYFVTVTWPHAVSSTGFRGENRSEPCATPLLCESMLPSTNKLYNSKTVFTVLLPRRRFVIPPQQTNVYRAYYVWSYI